MDNIKITLYTLTTKSYYSLDPLGFCYNPKGKLPKAQRILFWILKRLGTNVLREEVKTSTSELSTDDLAARLVTHFANVRNFSEFRDPVIVIGRDAFRELTKQNLVTPVPLQFTIPHVDKSYGVSSMRYYISGLPVVIVPWIDGLFLIPRPKI